MFLSLDGLVQTVRIPAARHDTPRKLIHDQNLVVLHHIILVPEHQVVGAQGQNGIVLDLQIFRIRVILDMEELFHLFHARLGKIDHLILLVDNKVPCLFLHHSHDGIHLGQFLHVLAPVHPAGQKIAHLIERGGFPALSGNDQRGPCLVDQHGVHLVDDRIMQSPQHQLFLIDNHIVTQIIESQLIVGHIGDVALICLLALLRSHTVQNHAPDSPRNSCIWPIHSASRFTR